MTTFRWTPYNTFDVAVLGTGAASATSINTLANAGYAYGAEIDNSTLLYLYGDLALSLSAGVTAVAPAFISVFLLANVDGNYSYATGNPGASQLAGTWSGIAGTIQFMQVRGIVLPPNKFKIVIQNNLGVAFPVSTTSTAKLLRYGEQDV